MALNILVLGATGPLGKCIVKQLIDAKVSQEYPATIGQVSVLARTPEKLLDMAKDVNVFQGDVLDSQVLHQALENQTIVIVTLGGHKEPICSTSMQKMNEWAEEKKDGAWPLKRVIVVSSIGVNESYEECSFLTKCFVNTFIRQPIADKCIQENLLRNGPFSKQKESDYVIVRPVGLGNEKVQLKYKVAVSGIGGGHVTRGDVAHFIVNKLVPGHVGDEYSNKAYTVA